MLWHVRLLQATSSAKKLTSNQLKPHWHIKHGQNNLKLKKEKCQAAYKMFRAALTRRWWIEQCIYIVIYFNLQCNPSFTWKMCWSWCVLLLGFSYYITIVKVTVNAATNGIYRRGELMTHVWLTFISHKSFEKIITASATLEHCSCRG